MVLTDNIIGYWKLDEASGNAIDATGNSKTFTQSGTVGSAAGIISNSRGLCGGGTNYFSQSLNFAYNVSITFSIWVKFNDTTSSGAQDIISFITAAGGYFIGGIATYSNNFVMDTHKYGSALITATKACPASFDTSHWYHLVGTFNASTNKINIWVDGVKGTEATYTQGAGTTSTTLHLGRLILFGGSERIRVDECGYWTRVLSDAEISSLYNSGLGLTYPFLTAPRFQINIGDSWKTVAAVKINIGDAWKDVPSAKINIGDSWKSI